MDSNIHNHQGNCSLIEYIYATHKPGDYIAPHRHEGYELIYYMGGYGITSIDKEEVPYRADTIQIVPPNVLHYDLSKTPTNVKCCVFQFGGNIVLPDITISKTARTEKQFNQILKQLYIIEKLLLKRDGETVGEEFGFFDDATGKAYTYEEVNDAVENELWFALLILFNLLEQNNHSASDTRKSIDYIKSYIKDNFNRTINFAILSEKVGYSYDRFRHIFKERTGITLKQYQQGIRIAYAKAFLEETSLPIRTIAERCGFNSHVRFSLWFAEKAGLTPKGYRAIMKKKPLGFNIVEVNT